MKITFTPEAWQDYLYWQKLDTKILRRVNELIKVVVRTPFDGKGKPEPLRYELKGFWSRRIDQEHRLIYKIMDDTLVIVSARFHYANK